MPKCPKIEWQIHLIKYNCKSDDYEDYLKTWEMYSQ